MIPGYAGYVHPCGAVSVGAIPPKKKEAQERRAKAAHKRILAKRNNADGTDLLDCLARQLRGHSVTISEAVKAISPLGLSSLQNSRNSQITGNQLDSSAAQASGREKPIKIYGAKGITSRGRLRVRDGATILERKYGRRSLTFATVTLPVMPEELLNKICNQWGEFVHRLEEEVKRELVRHNAPTEIVYCTEIQEHRYKKHGQVAPHLHLLWYAYELDIHGQPTGKYAITADWLRGLVKRLVYRITGNENISTGASVDTQKVKKSAANYLGKYMSKGGKVVEEIKKDGKGNLLPRTWWGMSRELRQQVMKAIIKIENNLAKNLFYHADKLQKMGILKKWDKVTINRTYHDIKINETINADIVYGLYGQLAPKMMHQKQLLKNVLDICDKLSDEDCEYLCKFISAMNNAEMVQDVCDVISALKEIMLENIDDNLLVDVVTGEISEIDFASL